MQPFSPTCTITPILFFNLTERAIHNISLLVQICFPYVRKQDRDPNVTNVHIHFFRDPGLYHPIQIYKKSTNSST